MKTTLIFFLNFYNKFITSEFLLYLLFMNIFLLLFIFLKIYNSFFKILINICFIFNIAIILSYLNGDFFSAFLLVAELPISMILIIFYFHKHSLKIDTIYKFKTLKINKYFYLFLIILLFFLNKNLTIYEFYNFFLLNNFNILNKNDFFIFFVVIYYINYIYLFFFALLIFFVSLLIILVYQTNKLQLFTNKNLSKSILFLRKQNMLKQAIFKSKLKFFNKKIKK